MTSRIAILVCALGAGAALAGAATPAQMQAIVQNGNGGPEVLSLQDVAVPEPAAGQVLIRVYAASVNPVDWKMRRGGMGPRRARVLLRAPGDLRLPR